jgi:PhnB protein
MLSRPKGYSTLTSVLVVKDTESTIELLKNVLDATVVSFLKNPKTNKVMHACISIGESSLIFSDPCPEMKSDESKSQSFYLYVNDVDKAYEKALSFGFESVEDARDMFWGDRLATLKDPNGHNWTLAQPIKTVSEEELMEAIAQIPS